MLKHGYMKRDREQPGGEEDFTKLPPSSSSSSHHTPLLPNNNSSGNSDDLLSMLPSQKKADMIALVNRLKVNIRCFIFLHILVQADFNA